MVQVLARATVDDFAQFIAVFSTRGLARRRVAGSLGSEVFRVGDHEVLILFKWDSIESFEQFFSDATVKAMMQSAGIQGPYETTVLERVGEFAA